MLNLAVHSVKAFPAEQEWSLHKTLSATRFPQTRDRSIHCGPSETSPMKFPVLPLEHHGKTPVLIYEQETVSLFEDNSSAS